MPFKPSDLGGQAPKVPHLGVLTDESGELLAIPPGAIMYIIEDPTNIEKIFPMALLKVNRREIVFKCVCHDPNCSRTFKYKMVSAAGQHVSERQRTQARANAELMK